jgi:hypothetical protein
MSLFSFQASFMENVFEGQAFVVSLSGLKWTGVVFVS